ncbi:complex I subunit 4 family protein [Flexivirga caeni]|uniref:NADH-quinone oxidoreductase subunit M n=1 Tax=Flexivirga caeni TaxID=2294115 RepID=A0A3M9M7Y5_9MICO|nr:NADH-quinone oxidoreductase subunit M [Flexivirga caeni]RNI21651.1 NADH-quinone oxidoreductase subunit M [Flexivirga caeni]
MVAALLVAPLAPIVAGLALVVGDRSARAVSRHTAYIVSLVVTVLALLACVVIAVQRPVLDRQWVPEIGMRLHLAVDGISVPLLLMTAAVGVLVVLHARHEQPEGGTPATFFGCLLLVIGGGIASFLVQDAISFFVAFEVVLVPMWVLIGRFGDRRDARERSRAANTFVLYTVLGSTLMLVGILTMTFAAGTSDFAGLAAHRLPAGQQTAVALILLIGLGIKVPMWPLHSWLPRAHTVAPTAGSMLLAAVLLKMGTYGLVRLVIAPLPDGVQRLAPYVATLAVIGIIWGGLVCLVERSLKRLVAWSSVAHMGFVLLGLMSGTAIGLQAALYANIAHGVISALLFAVVGGLKHRWGSDDLDTVRRSLRDISPRLSLALVIGFAASMGLPGLAGFWGEVLAIFGAWSPGGDRPLGWFRVLAAVASVGAVLAAAYALRVLRIVWQGRAEGGAPPAAEPETDAHGNEWLVAGALSVAAIALGVVPVVLLHTTSDAVTHLMAVTGR